MKIAAVLLAVIAVLLVVLVGQNIAADKERQQQACEEYSSLVDQFACYDRIG